MSLEVVTNILGENTIKRLISRKGGLEESGKSRRFIDIPFYTFLLLVMDCSITGSGRWIMFGPLSFRMMLGLIALIITFPKIIKKFKSLISNPMIVSLILFNFVLVISGANGFINGNRIDLIFTDLKGFAWLFIALLGIVLLENINQILLLMKVIIFSSVIHSLIVLVFNISLVFFDADAIRLMDYVQRIQFGFIEVIAEDLFRFSFGSTLSVVAGCIFMFYFQMNQSRICWLSIISIAICFFVLLISYTRSVYGATAFSVSIAIIGYFFTFPKKRKKIFLFWILPIAFSILMVFVFQTTSFNNYLVFGLQRSFLNTSFDILKEKSYEEDSDTFPVSDVIVDKLNVTKNSDSYREITKTELFEMIKKNPLMGNGLGASISSRPKGLVEYIYHDLINKIGIVGLMLYFFPVIYMFYNLVTTIKFLNIRWVIKYSWFCGLSSFLFATYFNPYMNCSLGICFYSLCIASFVCLAEKDITSIQ